MKIAMIFPGYSTQFVGMGKELYDDHRIIQEYFEEASNCLNVNFVKLCFASSDAELSKLHNAYTALFLVNAAIARLLQDEGVIPGVVTGYADGEYAALAAAKSISLPDGLYVLSKLSAFFEELLRESKMLLLRVTGATTAVVEIFCTQKNMHNQLFVAIIHSDTDYIVAGEQQVVESFRDFISDFYNVYGEYQSVGIGGHLPAMEVVAQHLKMYLEKVDFRDLKIPLLSQLDGAVVTNGAEVKQRTLVSIYSQLNFVPVIRNLHGYDTIVEVGNKTILHKILKLQYPGKNIVEVRKSSDVGQLLKLVRQ